ncbi:DHH family phosphoesterase [Clostridium perfringens]|nr:DHHA1 domain-containing protein [Clostridium perfringens]
MRKIKLFTHTDLDGVGCEIVSKVIFGKNNVDCELHNYDTINIRINEFIKNREYKQYRYVFITDISVNEEIANLIDNTCANIVILLDHHKTALHLNKYKWAKVELEGKTELTSGTELLLLDFNYGDRKVLNNWVENIKRWDTWLWSTKYNDILPKQLNDLYYLLGRDVFVEKALNCIYNEILVGDFILQHTSILNMKQKQIEDYIKSKNKSLIKITDDKHKIGIVFADKYHSELGNELSKLNRDCDYIMIIDGKLVNLRTIKDNVDCGKIAKEHNGGGHPKAAGFIIDEDKILGFIKNIL